MRSSFSWFSLGLLPMWPARKELSDMEKSVEEEGWVPASGCLRKWNGLQNYLKKKNLHSLSKSSERAGRERENFKAFLKTFFVL